MGYMPYGATISILPSADCGTKGPGCVSELTAQAGFIYWEVSPTDFNGTGKHLWDRSPSTIKYTLFN